MAGCETPAMPVIFLWHAMHLAFGLYASTVFWEVSISPGVLLALYSQWRSSQYSYWSPGSCLSAFGTCTWTNDFAPHHTEGTERMLECDFSGLVTRLFC